MARKSGNVVVPGQDQLPVQPVDRPILCSPYEEPRDHWIYDKETGAASRAGTRRPASYWYKTERTGSAQLTLTGLAEEERDDLPLVNALREDVRKWREAGYPGATNVTRDLLRHFQEVKRGWTCTCVGPFAGAPAVGQIVPMALYHPENKRYYCLTPDQRFRGVGARLTRSRAA